MNTTRLSIALFILRVGLGAFLLLWSIDKLVAPEGARDGNCYRFRGDR